MRRLVIFLLFIFLLGGVSLTQPKIERVSLIPAVITQKTDAEVEVVPEYLPEGYHFEYVWFVNGNEFRVNFPTFSAGNFKKGDFIWAGVYIKDKDGNVIDYKESLRYRVADIPPEIISSPPSAQGLKPGELYTYTVEVRDDDDPPESLKIFLKEAPKGAKLEENVLKWKIPKKEGKYTFTVVAEDPDGGSCALSFEISIKKEKKSRD